MISSVGFVPLGALKAEPVRENVSSEDLKRMKERLENTMYHPDDSSDGSDSNMESVSEDNTMIDGANKKQEAVQKAREVARQSLGNEGTDSATNDFMKELKLDEYDSEEDISRTSFLDHIVSSLPDEYSVAKREQVDEESSGEEESSDEDAMEISSSDIIILATKADEILSSIEIWLYEEADDQQLGNLLVHHDIPLSCYPLCCEYIDIKPHDTRECNIIVVGGMKTDLELYDLDILDPISPVVTLPIPDAKAKVSTFTLASNGTYRNILASGGDDKRVRLWDVAQGTMTSTMKLHKSEVQSIKWNPKEEFVLLSGGHDKKCSLSGIKIDARTPEGEALKWKLSSENEDIAWCSHQPTCFLASDVSGEVVMFDARNGSKADALFKLAAHKESTTVLSVSPLNSNIFMTGSEDGKVKIWNMVSSNPELVEKKNLGVGEVLAGGFCRFAGHLIIAAGEKGNLKVWDTRASQKITEHYSTDLYIPNVLLS